MHQPLLQPLIYRRLFPRPQPTDPTDFMQFVAKCIIPEVRQETHRFYGPEDSIESHYPGLDYASKAHRTRLRLYTWHRRLFRVFDELRLSDGEIHKLCRWEGTKYSKERFERENGRDLRDTTWDGVKDYGLPLLGVESIRASSKDPAARLRTYRAQGSDALRDMIDGNDFAAGEASETDDEIFTNSVGTALHQRLVAATAARARGENAVLDSAWEQWMKDVTERGLIRDYPGSSTITGQSSWSHPYQAYPTVPLPFPGANNSPRLHSSPSYGASPTGALRYSPSITSYASRSQTNDAHRRMAPPPLHPLPRIGVARSSRNARSSASPAS